MMAINIKYNKYNLGDNYYLDNPLGNVLGLLLYFIGLMFSKVFRRILKEFVVLRFQGLCQISGRQRPVGLDTREVIVDCGPGI